MRQWGHVRIWAVAEEYEAHAGNREKRSGQITAICMHCMSSPSWFWKGTRCTLSFEMGEHPQQQHLNWYWRVPDRHAVLLSHSVFPMCRYYTQFSHCLSIQPLHKCILSCHESVMASWVECTLHCWAFITRMSYSCSNETRNSRCLGRKLAETESLCDHLIFKGKDTIVFYGIICRYVYQKNNIYHTEFWPVQGSPCLE